MVNFIKCCRLCLKDDECSQKFNCKDITELCNAIYKHFTVLITENDELSTKICQECANKVYDFSVFYNAVQHNQQQLKWCMDIQKKVYELKNEGDDDDDDCVIVEVETDDLIFEPNVENSVKTETTEEIYNAKRKLSFDETSTNNLTASTSSSISNSKEISANEITNESTINIITTIHSDLENLSSNETEKINQPNNEEIAANQIIEKNSDIIKYKKKCNKEFKKHIKQIHLTGHDKDLFKRYKCKNSIVELTRLSGHLIGPTWKMLQDVSQKNKISMVNNQSNLKESPKKILRSTKKRRLTVNDNNGNTSKRLIVEKIKGIGSCENDDTPVQNNKHQLDDNSEVCMKIKKNFQKRFESVDKESENLSKKDSSKINNKKQPIKGVRILNRSKIAEENSTKKAINILLQNSTINSGDQLNVTQQQLANATTEASELLNCKLNNTINNTEPTSHQIQEIPNKVQQIPVIINGGNTYQNESLTIDLSENKFETMMKQTANIYSPKRNLVNLTTEKTSTSSGVIFIPNIQNISSLKSTESSQNQLIPPKTHIVNKSPIRRTSSNTPLPPNMSITSTTSTAAETHINNVKKAAIDLYSNSNSSYKPSQNIQSSIRVNSPSLPVSLNLNQLAAPISIYPIVPSTVTNRISTNINKNIVITKNLSSINTGEKLQTQNNIQQNTHQQLQQNINFRPMNQPIQQQQMQSLLQQRLSFNNQQQIQQMNQPQIQKINQPRFQQINQPQIQQINQPRIQQINQPQIQRINQPQIQQINQPQIQQINQPQIQQINQPQIQQINQQNIQQVNRQNIQQVKQLSNQHIQQINQQQIQQINQQQIQQMNQQPFHQNNQQQVQQNFQQINQQQYQLNNQQQIQHNNQQQYRQNFQQQFELSNQQNNNQQGQMAFNFQRQMHQQKLQLNSQPQIQQNNQQQFQPNFQQHIQRNNQQQIHQNNQHQIQQNNQQIRPNFQQQLQLNNQQQIQQNNMQQIQQNSQQQIQQNNQLQIQQNNQQQIQQNNNQEIQQNNQQKTQQINNQQIQQNNQQQNNQQQNQQKTQQINNQQIQQNNQQQNQQNNQQKTQQNNQQKTQQIKGKNKPQPKKSLPSLNTVKNNKTGKVKILTVPELNRKVTSRQLIFDKISIQKKLNKLPYLKGHPYTIIPPTSPELENPATRNITVIATRKPIAYLEQIKPRISVKILVHSEHKDQLTIKLNNLATGKICHYWDLTDSQREAVKQSLNSIDKKSIEKFKPYKLDEYATNLLDRINFIEFRKYFALKK